LKVGEIIGLVLLENKSIWLLFQRKYHFFLQWSFWS